MAKIKMSSNITPEQATLPPRNTSSGALDPNDYGPGELRDISWLGLLGMRRYMRSRLYTLRHEYIKIGNDLKVAVSLISDDSGPQRAYADMCKDYLRKAKENLNLRFFRKPSVYFCSSMLDLAASSLVWLYTDDTVKFRSKAVKEQIKDLENADDVTRPFKCLDEKGIVRCQQAVLADALEYFQPTGTTIVAGGQLAGLPTAPGSRCTWRWRLCFLSSRRSSRRLRARLIRAQVLRGLSCRSVHPGSRN